MQHQYILGLHELDEDGARFTGKDGAAGVSLTIPREAWVDLGRPGVTRVSVDTEGFDGHPLYVPEERRAQVKP